MDRKDLANLLEEVSVYLELAGANPFKARAFQNAARSLLKAELTDRQLLDPGRLTRIKGIGPSLARTIVAASATGAIPELEELKKSLPPGLIDLLRVPGLGAKRARQLYEGLGVASLGELAYAVNENRLLALPGFGVKTQQRIAQGLEFLKRHQNHFLFPDALVVAEDLEAHLARSPAVDQVVIVGQLRRRLEVINRVEVLASSTAPQTVLTHFAVWVKGDPPDYDPPAKASIRHPAGPTAAIEVVAPDSFAAGLVRTTGSPEHLAQLETYAAPKGFSLTEDGLAKDGRVVPLQTEADLYEALGLDYIEPECREGLGEIELAAAEKLPRLIEAGDIKGLFHVHTTASDGAYSLEEMASAVRAGGYDYLGLSDHSRSAVYAGGLSDKDLAAQGKEVARLNELMSPFHIFHGVESDILADGSLDYPDEVLAGLDFVIAAVHSQFNLSQERQTERLLRALSHPATTILAHPTGRLLLARKPYALDMDKVVAACAQAGVVMEINANPQRLDTDWRVALSAKEQGVRFAIGPDAHGLAGLADVAFGVGVARKARLQAEDVINCLKTEEAAELFRVRKERA